MKLTKLFSIAPLLTLPLFAAPALAESSALPQSLTCLFWPDQSSDIGADVSAIVAEVAVKRADVVQKGDLLLQLDDRIAQAELEKARILAEVAKDKLARAESLTAGRAISIEEMANLRGEAAMASADVLRAELMVDRLRITAPFDGVVAEVMTETGQLISNQPLLRLIVTRQLKAEIVFAAETFGSLKSGDKIRLHADMTDVTVEAEVLTVDSYISPLSNSYTVIAQLSNEDGRILAGTSCSLAP